MRTPRFRRDRSGGAALREKVAQTAAAAARFCGSDRAAAEQVLRDLMAAHRQHGIAGTLDGIHAYLASVSVSVLPPDDPYADERHAQVRRELQEWARVIVDREGPRVSGMVLAGLAHGVGMAADVWRMHERGER